eukprot:TRINITY_DN4782_c0_g1_i2.p1 TRINITY_DN4782_c0_g1~~TRINITY_DN4782_c0_g1_i2.p1  ORF type:complete len:411 (-),score=65.70 TRINITY_DN4782_c0_g1_i2:370-1602(-)
MVREDLQLFSTSAEEARRICEKSTFNVRAANYMPVLTEELQQDSAEACNVQKAPPPCLLRLRSEPVTRREMHTAVARSERVVMPLAAWAPQILCKVATGEIAIELASPRCLELESDEHLVELSKTHAVVSASVQADATRRAHRNTMKRDNPLHCTKPLPAFQQLQKQFLDKHGKAMREALRNTRLHNFTLNPAPVTVRAQQRFLQACGENPSLNAGWHGTKKEVHPSIFATGFRIPHASNGVRIAHGAAYGVGVYTAARGHAYLSCNYADSACLLACALLGGSKKVANHRTFMVTFDDTLVVPLFEACGGGVQPTSPAEVQDFLKARESRTVKSKRKCKDGTAVREAWKLVDLARHATSLARKQRRENLRKQAASRTSKTRVAAASVLNQAVAYLMRRAARKQHGVGSSQ